MSCSQVLSGILRDCSAGMGGIKEVLIANFDDVNGVTVLSNEISEIDAAGAFHQYFFKPETGSMTSTLNVDWKNGTNYVSTDLVLSFNRMEKQKRMEIATLAVGELAVIVKDNNDTYWYLGKENPVFATAGTGETGTARADKNGYSITLQDNASTYPYPVDSSIIASLIAA